MQRNVGDTESGHGIYSSTSAMAMMATESSLRSTHALAQDLTASLNKRRCHGFTAAETGSSSGDSTVDGPTNTRTNFPMPATTPSSICLCQAPARIPRPRNAFILFRQHHHATVMAQNPGKPNPEISKIIGHMWKTSGDAVKAQWQAHADEEKRQHLQRYPQYRYQPRRNSKKTIAAAANANGEASPLETAICNTCGGRTGVLQVATAPGPPSFRKSSAGSNSPPNEPHKTFNGSRMELNYLRHNEDGHLVNSGIDAGVEALLNLGLHAEDDALVETTKRRRLNPSLSSTTSSSLSDPSILSQSVYPTSFTTNIPEPSDNNPHLSSSTYLSGSHHSDPNYHSDDPAIARNLPILRKIQAIRRICPPLPSLASAFTNIGTPRLPIISIEGDNVDLINDLRHTLTQELLKSPNLPDSPIVSLGEPDDLAIITDSYLEGLLNTNHHQRHHRASSNPEAAKDDADVDAARYLTHVAAWRKRSTEIRKIVAAGLGDQGQERGQMVLINRYVLSRADAAASRLSADGLSPVEHWQWCASLFRSCVGPDLVVYVQEIEDGDPGPDVISPTREIDGARVLFVTWKPGGRGEWTQKVIRKLVYDIEVMARMFRGPQ